LIDCASGIYPTKIGYHHPSVTDSIVASSIALKHNRYQNHTKKRRLSDLKNSFTGVGLASVVFTILGVPMGGLFSPDNSTHQNTTRKRRFAQPTYWQRTPPLIGKAWQGKYQRYPGRDSIVLDVLRLNITTPSRFSIFSLVRYCPL
jgi:hypothetical protein